MKGKIVEVFGSVQGEGIYLGEKQLFVRFFGCNLNCKFCDTKPDRFTEYEPQELLEELKLYQDEYHSIAFTGGEPLLQKDFLKEVLKLTSKENFKNYLETNGTLPDELADIIDYLDIVAMDIKLPSSSGQDDFWHKHRKFLEIASRKEVFLKTVICKSTKRKDLVDALKLIREINKSLVLVLQPNSYEDGRLMKKKIEQFRDVGIKENIITCIIPQMHKVAWLK
jgi:organic radical activating enzyme